MSKICIIPSSIEMINKTLKYSDAYIIGIDKLSINMPFYFSLDEVYMINNILKENKKELFICLNKNMFNSDINLLEETLKSIDKLNIKGILYYDISLVELKENLNLKTDLVWSQEHFTTNYYTINYWYDLGVKYTYMSNEITLDELAEIRKNTDSKLMLQVFGYIPLFTSKRRLVNNYKEYFKLNNNSDIYYMEKEGYKYPLKENKDGTVVYSASPINSIKDFDKIDKIVDYSVLNCFLIDDLEFIEIVKHYFNREKFDSIYNDTYFLHKESIYKVIRNAKN